MEDLLEGWAAEIAAELNRQDRKPAWLARQVDVHQSTISRILAGKLNPNDELKWKIAGALGVRMNVLWAWPAITPPHPLRAADEVTKSEAA